MPGPSATERVSTATMDTALLGAQGPREHIAMLKDGEKGKQVEGKACIKAQDKRKGAWDCGQQPLQDRGGEGRQGWRASQCQTLHTCYWLPHKWL